MTVVYLFYFILVCWIIALSSDLNKLKNQVRALRNQDTDFIPLSQQIGKAVIFDFYDEHLNLDLYDQACIIIDVDQHWVYVKHVKLNTMHTINLAAIKQFKIQKDEPY